MLITATLSLGCAGASSQVLDTTGFDTVVKPSLVLIHAFEVKAKDVSLDEAGPGFATGAGSLEARMQVGADVADVLAELIVVELNKKQIAAKRARPGAAAPLHALVVRGQFIEIDEGDQMSRVVVGFGAGAEHLAVRVQIYQKEADGGLRRVREAKGEASGDKMPGVAVPIGVGGLAGNLVVSAAVSLTLNTVQELQAGLTQAAQNLAEQFADRTETIYEDRGWLD